MRSGLAAVVFALAAGCRSASRAPQGALLEERCGIFHVIWGDGPRYFLAQADGDLPLLLDEALTHPLGGPRALDRTEVCVTGTRAAPDSSLQVHSIFPPSVKP